MVDLTTNQAIIIAAISASSAIIGGLIAAGANYITEWQRSKREAVMFQQDKEAREIELRNQAYIKFLSINEDQVSGQDDNGHIWFNLGSAAESVALVLTHGSPKATSLVAEAYPFKDWEELERIMKAVMKELVIEKGEKWYVPLAGISATRASVDGNMK